MLPVEAKAAERAYGDKRQVPAMALARADVSALRVLLYASDATEIGGVVKNYAAGRGYLRGRTAVRQRQERPRHEHCNEGHTDKGAS